MGGYNLADLTFSPCWLFKLPPSIVINCTTGKNYCLFNRIFSPRYFWGFSRVTTHRWWLSWKRERDLLHKGDASLQEDRGCFSLNTSEGGSPVPGGGDVGLYAAALLPPGILVLCRFHPDLCLALYWSVPIWVQTLIFYSQGIAKIRPSSLPRSCWTSRRDLQPNVWFISAALWGGSSPGHQAPSSSYRPFLAAPCLAAVLPPKPRGSRSHSTESAFEHSCIPGVQISMLQMPPPLSSFPAHPLAVGMWK